MPAKSFQGPLYERIIAREFTIPSFAQALGLKPRTIRRWLEGTNSPLPEHRTLTRTHLGLTKRELRQLLKEQARQAEARMQWQLVTDLLARLRLGKSFPYETASLVGIDDSSIHNLYFFLETLRGNLKYPHPEFLLRNIHRQRLIAKGSKGRFVLAKGPSRD